MLLLDIGNSRCKWAVVKQGAWVQQGVVPNDDVQALEAALSGTADPQCIIVSNVAGEVMAQRVREVCVARWGCQPHFTCSRVQQCGVSNGYEQAESLGSDRWAALIAARHSFAGACLVVNCGTATTVDALSAQGEFLGGLILPGLELMRQSLAADTAQLLLLSGEVRDFPRNTADAIQSGVIRATAGAIAAQYTRMQKTEENVSCLLSGGAADAMEAHLEIPVVKIENLVLHGLKIIGESETW